jgi:hypothetical protein
MKHILLLVFIATTLQTAAQDVLPFTPTGEAKYFDFWEGNWYPVKENGALDTTQWFKVKRGVHPSSFVEDWKMNNGIRAIGLRAWDKINNKWGYVWVSDNGLYQVWDTRLIDGDWYIYREFTVNGDKYLSRQSFKLQADGTVLRMSEKSYDDKNWQLRFKQVLKKKE